MKVFPQAEEGPYWSRLLEDKTKVHWLKVDFNKWKDEDDSENEDEVMKRSFSLEKKYQS